MTATSYPRPIVIVGLMGSGKTTIGRALAHRIGYRFVDNDAGIEAEYDATVGELAERLGVAELHRIEAAQLDNALTAYGSEEVVIAAAASVADDAASRARLSTHTVVWLRADPAYLAGRLLQPDHRPNLGLDRGPVLAAQADLRHGDYQAISTLVVDVEGRSVHDIVEEICRGLAPLPRLYTDLAGWFHLLTPPSEYAEEAAFYFGALQEAATRPIETVLELGSGGGNNASHMKHRAALTLVDLSPQMLEVSRSINPECEHLVGDMRTVRLDRRFDAVFVHDAVDYLLTVHDLASAIETAVVHCRPGGAVLFAPDDVAETFRPTTITGGHRDETRALRYEERSWEPEPGETSYLTRMTYWLEEAGEAVRVVEDMHRCGLFPRATWLALLADAGLAAAIIPSEHSEQDHVIDVFVGTPEAEARVDRAQEVP